MSTYTSKIDEKMAKLIQKHNLKQTAIIWIIDYVAQLVLSLGLIGTYLLGGLTTAVISLLPILLLSIAISILSYKYVLKTKLWTAVKLWFIGSLVAVIIGLILGSTLSFISLFIGIYVAVAYLKH